MSIADRRVLVTGASGGIGKCIASKLIDAGESVLLHCRARENLEDYVAQRSLPDYRIRLIEGDLTCQADLARIVDSGKEFGVNTLINNAGINEFAAFEESDIANIVNTNVIATMQLTQALLPHFRTLPHAAILNIGSTFGSIGFAGYVVYSATKHATKGFTEALRRELADTNIKVLYIAPRATATKMNPPNVTAVNRELKVKTDSAELVAEEVLDTLHRSRPTKQLGWPEKLQVKVNALFPGVVDSALLKQLPVIKQHMAIDPDSFK